MNQLYSNYVCLSIAKSELQYFGCTLNLSWLRKYKSNSVTGNINPLTAANEFFSVCPIGLCVKLYRRSSCSWIFGSKLGSTEKEICFQMSQTERE